MTREPPVMDSGRLRLRDVDEHAFEPIIKLLEEIADENCPFATDCFPACRICRAKRALEMWRARK